MSTNQSHMLKKSLISCFSISILLLCWKSRPVLSAQSNESLTTAWGKSSTSTSYLHLPFFFLVCVFLSSLHFTVFLPSIMSFFFSFFFYLYLPLFICIYLGELIHLLEWEWFPHCTTGNSPVYREIPSLLLWDFEITKGSFSITELLSQTRSLAISIFWNNRVNDKNSP